MDNNEDIKKIIEKEEEYTHLFEEFTKSSSDRQFTKIEVEKIIEAHLFKEIVQRYDDTKKSMKKNIIVSSKEMGAKIFNVSFLIHFGLTYLFYIGILILISTFVYEELFILKYSVFVIGIVLTLVDKMIKPLIFIADLISFTYHKIGLITLSIYTLVVFFLLKILEPNNKISFERVVIVSILILLLTFVIDYIKNDSFIKTRYIDDETLYRGSDDDEEPQG